MPSFPELSDPLTDGVVELREASEWDIPDVLIAHQDDPELHRRLGLVRPPSGAELGRRSERDPAERAAGAGVRLTILEPGDPTCRGQLEVHNVQWAERRAELRIWVAPQRRGRGLATRALRLASSWLSGRCGLERLDVLAEADNPALLGAARAAGFTTAPGEGPAEPLADSIAAPRRPVAASIPPSIRLSWSRGSAPEPRSGSV